MEEDRRKERKQNILIVIGLFVLITMVGGLTYAFFNYNKTGVNNVLRLGNISFSSDYEEITLGNAFPVSKESIQNSNTESADLTVTITGKTSYNGGIDYRVKAIDVQIEVGEKDIPISLYVTQSGLDQNGNEIMLFSFEDGAQVFENAEFAAGHIVKSNNETSGSIMLKAYVNASNVVVSDTYGEDGETDSNFGEGKVVLTTEEWNALQGESGGVSFKIKVEAEEGDDNPNAVGHITYNKNGLVGTTPKRQSLMGTNDVILGDIDEFGFQGWSTSATATTATYHAGDSISLTGNNTLYAVWDFGL